MKEQKVTKLEQFKGLLAFLIENEASEAMVDFVDQEIKRMEVRAEKDAERRAAKSKEASEMDNQILELLGKEPKTATEITMAFIEAHGMVDGISDGKVASTMKKFADQIEKVKVKGRVAYQLA